MPFDPASWRDAFPILSRRTYLVSHSLGAVPEATSRALQEYYEAWATLGVEAWSGPWWEAVTDFSARLERLINAAPGTVVPMQNVTRAFAAIASCFEYAPPRNRIVMTGLEFTTSFPFWKAQERLGAELVVVDSDDGMTIPTQRVVDAIDERTLLVPTSHVYFRSACIQDLKPIVEAAHDAGAYVLGDGYQSVGSIPVDVQELGVDMYTGGCHKWLCGGPGAGWLYVRPDLIPTLRPRLTGWFGMADPFSFDTAGAGGALNEGVYRFLGGTPNVPACYAAREGLRIVEAVGVDAIRAHAKAMTERIIGEAEQRGVEIRTPRDPDRRTGMVCLQFEGSEAAAKGLIERDVMIDWRPDCGIRISAHFYTTPDDIERFFKTLDAVRQPAAA